MYYIIYRMLDVIHTILYLAYKLIQYVIYNIWYTRVCFAILYDVVLDTTLYEKISLDCLFSCLLYYIRIFLRASYKHMLHCNIVCHLPWYYMILRYHTI